VPAEHIGSLSPIKILFGPFELSTAERSLKKAGEVVPVGGRAFDILTALIDKAGEVVSKGELIAKATLPSKKGAFASICQRSVRRLETERSEPSTSKMCRDVVTALSFPSSDRLTIMTTATHLRAFLLCRRRLAV
jgi:DNA-binding response OmpR family regulator